MTVFPQGCFDKKHAFHRAADEAAISERQFWIDYIESIEDDITTYRTEVLKDKPPDWRLKFDWPGVRELS